MSDLPRPKAMANRIPHVLDEVPEQEQFPMDVERLALEVSWLWYSQEHIAKV